MYYWSLWVFRKEDNEDGEEVEEREYENEENRDEADTGRREVWSACEA